MGGSVIYIEALACYQLKCSGRYLSHAKYQQEGGAFNYEAGLKPPGPLTAPEWLELTAFVVGEMLRHTPLPKADGSDAPEPVRLVRPVGLH
jgi:hypothetical protein